MQKATDNSLSEKAISDLTQETKNLISNEGAHLVGVASVDRFEGAPKGHHPRDLIQGARSVVVFAHHFFQSILESDRFGERSDLIRPERDEEDEEELRKLQTNFFSVMYGTVNMRLQMIGVQVVHFLSSRGYKSLAMEASAAAPRKAVRAEKVGNQKGGYSLFSHRHAAVLAGLGEIGLNNLLLTPQYGPRVRLESVITTAPLVPNPMLQEQLCPGEEECGLCLKAKCCFGEVEEWDVGGKKMPVAKFRRCYPVGACPDAEGNTLPFTRYCWAICPVGQKL